jgi:putative transposase
VSVERGRVALPMGRGRASLVLPLDLPSESGACTLVWNHGFELHVCIEVPQAEHTLGTNRAIVDLGEIHLEAVTTNTGAVLVVSGRGIRSFKRQRTMRHRQLARKQARCQKYSRRWKKLQRAKNKMAGRIERRVRDLRHKATRQVLDFCVEQQVDILFIGNRMGCVERTKDAIITSVWRSGSTDAISTISPTRASLHQALHWLGTRDKQPVSSMQT